MARIEVHTVSMDGDKVEKLGVKLFRLGEREIDRQTAVQWMKDGHSFIPQVNGDDAPALQLVDVEGEFFIRSDIATEAQDSVAL